MDRAISVRRRRAASRCGYCHAAVGQAGRGCADCGAVLHADCWRLQKTCPTLGCRARGAASSRPELRSAATGPEPLRQAPLWFRSVLYVYVLAHFGVYLHDLYPKQSAAEASFFLPLFATPSFLFLYFGFFSARREKGDAIP